MAVIRLGRGRPFLGLGFGGEEAEQAHRQGIPAQGQGPAQRGASGGGVIGGRYLGYWVIAVTGP